MNKWLLILGATLLGAIFLYGALTALIHQGLSLIGAIVMLVLIMVGGVALLWALR